MKNVMVIVLVFLVCQISAQKITPEIISSAGTTIKNADISLQWTLGEQGIQSFRNNNLRLNEGFNQDFTTEMSTGLSTIQLEEQVILHPNPVRTLLSVTAEHPGILVYKLYDARGKLLENGKFTSKLELSTVELSDGTYFLQLKTVQNRRGLYSFVKI